MKNNIFIFLLLFFLFSFSLQTYAQNNGTADGITPPASDPGTVMVPPEEKPLVDPVNTSSEPAPTSAPISVPTPIPAGTVTPKTTITRPSITKPTEVTSVLPIAPENNNNESVKPPASNNLIIPIAVGIGILGILGFFGLKLKKNKKQDEKKDDSKCLNLKKLMEDKLNEFTDLESQLISLAKKQASKQIKNVINDTKTGNLLILIENGKKEYERLKKLYEKCMIDFSIQKTTLLFLYKPKEKKILLAMKKRSFGNGKWNGVGGKLEKGESIKGSLRRETQEEIIVIVKEDDMIQVATLDFFFKDNPGWNQQSHVFFTEKWEGEPAETEEMRPMWYDTDSLPFDSMWIDDPNWLPLVLQGKKLNATFNFNKTGDEILEMKIEEI